MKDNPKHLFSISSGDKVISERYNNNVMDDLYRHLTNITKINMTTYRAGCAIAELIIHYDSEKTFLLTIWESELNCPPLSSDDIRLAHKEIALPDIADIMIFVTTLARHARLSPCLPSDQDSAEVLTYV